MIEDLERALLLVQRALRDATAGVAAGLAGPDLAELAGVVLEPPRVWWRVLISRRGWSHACTEEVQRRAA
jgi:hypothetical protein